MAKSYIKCATPGCDTTITIIERNRKEADRKAAWYESRGELCSECYRKQQEAERAAASAKAAAEAAELGLPTLQGSEKQIAWAETIRKTNLEKLDRIESFANNDTDGSQVIFDAFDAIRKQDSAHWWIENRDAALFVTTRDFVIWLVGGVEYCKLPVPELLSRAEHHFGGIKRPAAESAPAEIIADAKAEATVRPESPKTETVAEIHIAGNELQIAFPEKREDFRLIMRNTLSMEWTDGYWGRQIGQKAGPVDDRTVEAAHRLLAAGFIIRLFDPELRARAISGEFQPEHTRWVGVIAKGKHPGWFSISWSRTEDYYAAARKIPRSSYDKPYVCVPPEEFEELLDFAGRYDFRLTDTANAAAEQARVNRDAALVAKVEAKPKAKGKKIDPNKPEALPVIQSPEVDDALRDE